MCEFIGWQWHVGKMGLYFPIRNREMSKSRQLFLETGKILRPLLAPLPEASKVFVLRPAK